MRFTILFQCVFRYCTMNELLASQSEDPNCYIVFITKLSRIASGNKYIGFQGGESIHILK